MILEYRSGYIQYKKYIFLPLMKLSAVIIIATIVLLVWFDISRENMLVVVALTWSWIGLIHLMPLLIMGIRHSRSSKGAYLCINTANNQCQYKEKNIDFSFGLDEIDKVIKVVSPPKYDSRMDFLGFGYFFYWKFMFVDGRVLSISCMVLDVDDFLGDRGSKEKQLFPIPPSNRGLY